MGGHNRPTSSVMHATLAVFLFFYFSISFFIIFFFEIYRTGRPAAWRQGLFYKKFHRKFTLGSLEDRSPGSGAARCRPPGSEAVGPQAARLWGDRLPSTI